MFNRRYIKLFDNIMDAYSMASKVNNPTVIVHTLSQKEINTINLPGINVTLYVDYRYSVRIVNNELDDGFIIDKKELLRLLS